MRLRARRSLSSAVLVAGLCVLPRPLHAQQALGVALRWSHGEGCIDAEELRERVAGHLEIELRESGDALAIEGEVARSADGRGFEAALIVGGDAGTRRELFARGDDCRALDEALVLVMAVAIEALAPKVAQEEEGEARGSALPSTSASTFTSTSTSTSMSIEREQAHDDDEDDTHELAHAEDPREAQVDVEVDEPEEAADSENGAVRLAIGSRVASGLMPGIAGGVLIALSLPLSRALQLELAAALWPSGLRPTSAGDATFRAAQLDALACPALLEARHVRLHGCGGLWGGALQAHSELVGHAAVSSVRPLAGASALLGADFGHGMGGTFALRARAGLSYQLVRDRFTVLDTLGREVTLHRVAALTPTASAELVMAF